MATNDTTSNPTIRLIINSPANEIALRIAYDDTEERARLKGEGYQWLPTLRCWRKAWRSSTMSPAELTTWVQVRRDALVADHDYYIDDDWQTQGLVSPENLRVATANAALIADVSEGPDGRGRTWTPMGELDGYHLFSIRADI